MIPWNARALWIWFLRDCLLTFAFREAFGAKCRDISITRNLCSNKSSRQCFIPLAFFSFLGFLVTRRKKRSKNWCGNEYLHKKTAALRLFSLHASLEHAVNICLTRLIQSTPEKRDPRVRIFSSHVTSLRFLPSTWLFHLSERLWNLINDSVEHTLNFRALLEWSDRTMFMCRKFSALRHWLDYERKRREQSINFIARGVMHLHLISLPFYQHFSRSTSSRLSRIEFACFDRRNCYIIVKTHRRQATFYPPREVSLEHDEGVKWCCDLDVNDASLFFLLDTLV